VTARSNGFGYTDAGRISRCCSIAALQPTHPALATTPWKRWVRTSVPASSVAAEKMCTVSSRKRPKVRTPLLSLARRGGAGGEGDDTVVAAANWWGDLVSPVYPS
jgi:hypothetical protein